MVEAIANGIEDKLIDGLSFKMNPGASYVIDRRSVTFHPQSSNIIQNKGGYEAHPDFAHWRQLDGPEHPEDTFSA